MAGRRHPVGGCFKHHLSDRSAAKDPARLQLAVAANVGQAVSPANGWQAKPPAPHELIGLVEGAAVFAFNYGALRRTP